MTTYPQCTEITPKMGIQFKNPRTGRTVRLLAGQSFWISSTTLSQKLNGTANVCRSNQPMGAGWDLSLEDIAQHFEVTA